MSMFDLSYEEQCRMLNASPTKAIYGRTLELDGRRYGAYGHFTALSADIAAYRLAILSGWKPKPLRRHWWQFWRPTEYEEGYVIAELQLLDGFAQTP